MKLTDFCIIFAALFVCLFLGRDLQIGALCAQRVTGISYNRQMDRIAEDAIMDIVETEYGDGTPALRAGQLERQYERLLGLAFELADDGQRLHVEEAVTLWQLCQYPYALSAQELDRIVEGMEEQANEAKRRRRETQLVAVAMPYLSHEPWYQTLAGPQFVTVFDPREAYEGYDRAVLSGSRILKLPDQKLVVVK